MLSACDIEDYSIEIVLNPPLGLKASVSNVVVDGITNESFIFLNFWAYNDEHYFNGYRIYTADTLSDLTNENTNSYRMVLHPTDSNSLVTIQKTPFTREPEEIRFNMKKDADWSPLQNKEYFFHVKSYSREYNAESLPSNFTNVVFE
jgi:hypothetical protein